MSKMRKRYPTKESRENELLTSKRVADPSYNALEEDIAVVNIYFGSYTTFGQYWSILF